MSRMNLTLCAAFLLCACDTGAGDSAVAGAPEAATAAGVSVTSVTRERVTGDVFHHAYVVRLGSAPNAQITIHRIVRERAPWLPRPTSGAAMFLHGDFATFISNFAPSLGDPPSPALGIAPYLAQRNIDVWGFDRRWTQAPTEGADISDFAGMTVAQDIDDTGTALVFARAIRLITSGSLDRLVLVGFSHGAQLAYAYASAEAPRPALQRHIKGLVPLDIYANLSPEDEPLRLKACRSAAGGREALAGGFVDGDNSFFIGIGLAALAAPDDPSVIFGDGSTNRQAVDFTAGLTWQFFSPTPRYHLAAPILDADGNATALRESPENVIDTWFAQAPFHESVAEGVDFDTLWCNEAPLPVDVPLSRIRVPLFYIGAAGGFGKHGLYSTTQVSSTDVTTLVIQRFDADREDEDFGHGDIIYGTDAPQLVWQKLAAWILAH